MNSRLVLIAALSGLTAACATTEPEPTCRTANAAERALFGAIVAHNEAGVADMMADTPEAARLRSLDPALEAQIFGARMGDTSVRTVLMQPPLCLYDGPAVDGMRTTYVFPAGRFEALQNVEIAGPELGRSGTDHAACRFVETETGWQLADACLATFGSSSPAS